MEKVRFCFWSSLFRYVQAIRSTIALCNIYREYILITHIVQVIVVQMFLVCIHCVRLHCYNGYDDGDAELESLQLTLTMCLNVRSFIHSE